MMMKRVWKTVKGIAAFSLAVVLIGLTGMAFLHIYRKLGTAPQTTTGDGWGQGQTDLTSPISPQEFADNCAALESYLAENAVTEADWRNRSRDGTIWGLIDQILVYGPEELPEDEALLYRELACAERLRRWENSLPDYCNYLSETDGILNEIWMYAAMGQGDGRRQGDLTVRLQEAVRSLEWQREAGYVYPAQQLETAIGQCGCLLEEGLPGGSQAGLRDAVASLLSCLKEMEGTEEIVGLCQLPLGADYYNYLLERETGSGMDGGKMYAALSELRTALQQRLQDLDTKDAGSGLCEADAQGLLKQLIENTLGQFGGIPGRPYELRELPEMLEDRYYIGFYQKDASDGSNVIYINQAHAGQNAYEKYEMLAHEGYPGHMYCDACRDDSPYALLRRCLAGKGYNEGWAVYSEFLAAQWLLEDREGYLAFVTQKLLDETILCQMDIGIHALGWGEEELEEYGREIYGEIDPEGVAAVGRRLSGQPAMYQSYVVGYMQVCRLESAYMEEGHSREEFVEWFMRQGQASFTDRE